MTQESLDRKFILMLVEQWDNILDHTDEEIFADFLATKIDDCRHLFITTYGYDLDLGSYDPS